MKRVIIIHAWDSHPKDHWYEEERKILENKGYKVFVPTLPGERWPKLEEWLKIIEELKPDEDTILIGHSLGPAAIFRYLEKNGQRVGTIISIAGFTKSLGLKETDNFVEKPFDWDIIKKNTNKIISIAQQNDPYVPIDESKEIANRTGGEFILVDGTDHFDKIDFNLINNNL